MKNGGKLEEEAWKWSLERCKSRADGWVALNGVMIFFFSMLRNCYATLDNGQCSVCLRNINLKIKSCFTLFLAHEIHVTRPCRHHKLHVHVFAVTNMWMRQYHRTCLLQGVPSPQMLTNELNNVHVSTKHLTRTLAFKHPLRRA